MVYEFWLNLTLQIEMLTPKDYIGALMELGQDRRGVFKEMNFISENRASITYELPLAEVNILILKWDLDIFLFFC